MRSAFVRGFKAWCEKVAIQQRRELRFGEGDPLDAFALAQHLQTPVWQIEDLPGLDEHTLRILTKTDSDSWSAITLSSGRHHLVVVNSTHSPRRQQSDVMHELSHIILDHKPAQVFIQSDGIMMLSEYDKKQEDEAHWLAGCLLLPRAALVRVRFQRLTEEQAMDQYGVSQDMLTYRFNVTGVDYQLSHLKPNRSFRNKG